jgi:hypothetical protein
MHDFYPATAEKINRAAGFSSQAQGGAGDNVEEEKNPPSKRRGDRLPGIFSFFLFLLIQKSVYLYVLRCRSKRDAIRSNHSIGFDILICI